MGLFRRLYRAVCCDIGMPVDRHREVTIHVRPSRQRPRCVCAGAFVFISLDQEGSMQVWILMRRTVWDGRVTSWDVVDEVFSSEIAAERARREKENAAKDQLNADRYSVEGPFEV